MGLSVRVKVEASKGEELPKKEGHTSDKRENNDVFHVDADVKAGLDHCRTQRRVRRCSPSTMRMR